MYALYSIGAYLLGGYRVVHLDKPAHGLGGIGFVGSTADLTELDHLRSTFAGLRFKVTDDYFTIHRHARPVSCQSLSIGGPLSSCSCKDKVPNIATILSVGFFSANSYD